MFSSRNNIPVQCQICGFHFAILVGAGVRLVWCPSCGVEFTCTAVAVDPDGKTLSADSSTVTESDKFSAEVKSVEFATGGVVGDEVPGDILAAGGCLEDNNSEFDQNSAKTRHECNDCDSVLISGKRLLTIRRWRILFAAVSVQVIALIMLPVIIFSTQLNPNLNAGGDGVIANGGTATSGGVVQTNQDSVAFIPNIKIPEPFKPSILPDNEDNTPAATNSNDSIVSKNIVPKSIVPNSVVQNDTNESDIVQKNIDEENDELNVAGISVVGRAETSKVSSSSSNANDSGNSSNSGNFVASAGGDDSNGQVSGDNIETSFVDVPSQPTNRVPDKSKLQHIANLPSESSNSAVERLVRSGAGFDLGVVASGEDELESESVDVVNLSAGEMVNLLFSENENNTNKIDENTPKNNADIGESAEVLTYEMQLTRAREQLIEGSNLAAISPERSLQTVVQAIKRYKELGQVIPSEAKWILSRSYVMRRWGEALVENIPELANMAMSADGQWLWCRCEDNTVWFWDMLRSRKTLGGFKLDAGDLGLVRLVFTPDFRFAIGVGGDGLVRVWNMESSESERSMAVLGGKVSNPTDVQISPDGRWLVVSGVINEVATRGGEEGDVGDFVGGMINDFSGLGAVWLWDLDSVKDGEMITSCNGLEPVVLRGHTKSIRVL
ncbi:MAG: hypothetical protein LBJ00_10670, partial [Planctomycetaceae bacterium]|nr:hypothetical protein [Planctomycetaceae bacterium]